VNFKELCKIPVTPAPANFPQARTVTMHKGYDGRTYKSNTENYNYQAEAIDNNLLIITVYYGDIFVFRIFQSKNNWSNQIEGKTSKSEAMTYNIGSGWYGNAFHPMNNADETIYNWLKKHWWEINNFKKSDSYGAFCYKNGYELLGKYQQQLRREQLANKHNIIRNAIDNAMLEIKDIPKAFVNFCDRKVSQQFAYIFFNNETKTGECSSCHRVVNLKSKAKHNETGKCPNCHHNVTFISANRWRNMSRFSKDNTCAFLQPVSNGFCIRIFNVKKTFYPKNYQGSTGCSTYSNFKGENFISRIELHEKERSFCDFKGRALKSFTWGDFLQTGQYRWCNDSYSSGWDMWVYTGTFDSITKQMPEIKYIPLKNIVKAGMHNPMTIIKNAVENPFIEYTWKLGLKTITQQILHRNSYYLNEVVNRNGKNIFEVLGTDKQDLKQLVKLDISISQLDVYHTVKKNSPAIDWDIYNWVIKNSVALSDVENIQKITTLSKAIKYFEKQYKQEYAFQACCDPEDICDDDAFEKISDVIGDWIDYIGECQKLEYNLTDTAVIFPKNLQTAHQRTLALVKILNEKSRIEKCKNLFSERAVALKSYAFKNKQFLIRAVETPEEIVREGAVLSHCVGGYMERHAEGKLNIFVIRQIDKPDIPFYTLELTTDFKISQTRGFKNKSAPTEVNAFIKKWEQHLAKLKSKQERVKVTA